MRALIFCLGFFSALTASGQEPIIEWLTPTTHDFGLIEHRERVSYQFAFRNISPEPVLIHNVRTTCGCTASDYSEDPVLPDSTANITIEYDGYKKNYHKGLIKVYISGQRKAEKLYIEAHTRE